MTGGAPYDFAYREEALSCLRGLTKKLRRQIVNKIEQLANDPYPPTCRLVQGMKDGEDRVYRIRSGDYRVLYVLRSSTIVILDIGDRKDIY